MNIRTSIQANLESETQQMSDGGMEEDENPAGSSDDNPTVHGRSNTFTNDYRYANLRCFPFHFRKVA